MVNGLQRFITTELQTEHHSWPSVSLGLLKKLQSCLDQIHSRRQDSFIRTEHFDVSHTNNSTNSHRTSANGVVNSKLQTSNSTNTDGDQNEISDSVKDIQKDNQYAINDETPAKRFKKELITLENISHGILVELETMKEVRERTFSHSCGHSREMIEKLIDAGFFYCNVADRVICIYCNIICQEWINNVDDPIKVHKLLSPTCPYVRSMISSVQITMIESLPLDFTTFSTMEQREASFETWPNESLPSAKVMAKAGFFFTGSEDTVICFWCHGALKNWSDNDKPIKVHAKLFPNCQYAKKMFDEELSEDLSRSRTIRATHRVPLSSRGINQLQRLEIPDNTFLNRLVAARLDLPVSQRLLDQPFRLAVIKRVWEDQLRLKHDDFLTDTDVYIACLILQKQIDHINGRKENIIIPSAWMERMNNKQMQSEGTSINSQTSAGKSSSETPQEEKKTLEVEKLPTPKESDKPTTTTIPLMNPCLKCGKQEKKLACIPCGDFVLCDKCATIIRHCPKCYRSIEAFVRVFI